MGRGTGRVMGRVMGSVTARLWAGVGHEGGRCAVQEDAGCLERLPGMVVGTTEKSVYSRYLVPGGTGEGNRDRVWYGTQGLLQSCLVFDAKIAIVLGQGGKGWSSSGNCRGLC